MRTITLSTIAMLAATGCVYDNNCPDRGKVGKGELTDTGQEEAVGTDTVGTDTGQEDAVGTDTAVPDVRW